MPALRASIRRAAIVSYCAVAARGTFNLPALSALRYLFWVRDYNHMVVGVKRGPVGRKYRTVAQATDYSFGNRSLQGTWSGQAKRYYYFRESIIEYKIALVEFLLLYLLYSSNIDNKHGDLLFLDP